MGERCQVDFYVLASPAQSAGHLACRLAMRAWEAGHKVLVRTENQAAALALDELMWESPPGRFLPHATGTQGEEAPVRICHRNDAEAAERDLVINLCADPVAEPARYRRLLEIVPADPAQRQASREKFKTYRALGLDPANHTIKNT